MRNTLKVLTVGLFLSVFLIATVLASCSDPFGKFGNPVDPANSGGGPDSEIAVIATPSTVVGGSTTSSIIGTTIPQSSTTSTTAPIGTSTSSTTIPATTTTVPATTTTTSTTLPVVTTTSTSTTSTSTTSTTSTSTSTTSTSTTSTTLPVVTTTSTSTTSTSTTTTSTTSTSTTSTSTTSTTTTTVPSGILPNGTYKITNFGTGRIQDAANSVGAKVFSSEVYDSTNAEKWTVTRSGGHYSIVNVGSGYKMGSTDGDKVTTGDANGNREQWEIVEDGIGRYRLINRHYDTIFAQNENTGEDGEMKLAAFNPPTADTFRWTFTAP